MAGLRHNLVFGRGGVLGGGGGFGGGGGGDPFGAIGGFINSMGWNPELEQARQLQQAKMEEIQTRTQAQQAALRADAEDQAQYNQLAERMFPSGGRTVTETGPPQIETEPGDIPVGNQLTEQNQPLTDSELLMRQLVRSRNQKILQSIALQQPSQSGPPSVFDIGGGHQVIQQPSGNYAFVPREPKEPVDKTLNPNDLAAFVSSGGTLRGPSIPSDMTFEQGKATLGSIRSIGQQNINIKAPFYEALGGLRAAQTQGLYGQLPVDPKTIGNYSDAQGRNPQADPRFINPADRTQQNLNQAGYRTLDQQSRQGLRMSNIATTQLDRMDKMVDELYKGVEPLENLGNAIKLKGQRFAASGLIREFDTLRNETMPAMGLASGLTAGRVGEQILEKIEKPMLPDDRDSYQSAKGKIRQLRQRLENNARVFYGTGIDRQIRVRDKGTGATGTLRLAPGELIPDNYEAQR